MTLAGYPSDTLYPADDLYPGLAENSSNEIELISVEVAGFVVKLGNLVWHA